MYKDIISYELAEGKSQEQLLTIAQDIIDNWMKKLPGFQKWEIHALADGSFCDIVYWENMEAAKNAEKEMANIPNAMDWYSCYKPESIKSKNLSLIKTFSS